jgi:outer membrane protein
MKTLRILAVSIVASIIATNYASAQVTAETQKEVMKFSLAQAQEYAVQNATKALNANLEATISKKRTLEIITEGLPQVSGSFNYQNNFKQQKSIIPAGVFSPGELEVTFVNPYQSYTELNVDQLLVD